MVPGVGAYQEIADLGRHDQSSGFAVLKADQDVMTFVASCASLLYKATACGELALRDVPKERWPGVRGLSVVTLQMGTDGGFCLEDAVLIHDGDSDVAALIERKT